MNIAKAITLVAIGSVWAQNGILAQGCSDAGFCTVGSLAQKPTFKRQEKKQSLSVNTSFGLGDESVFIVTPTIQYENQLTANWRVQGRVTANFASGDLGNATGLGDAYLSASYSVPTTKKWQKSFTLGAKIPLNNGNLLKQGLPLPMPYQSSLGTFDLILGVAISDGKWLFAGGWQQPLSGTNGNTFLPAYWNDTKAKKYIPTNDFTRKSDLLLRASYTFKPIKKLQVSSGLLGIYHVANDTYIDANTSPNPIALQHSKGLTLNATAFANYSISTRITLSLSGGVPLVIRDIRPDGLTRGFVVIPEIKFHF
ncbi:MAG: hypothetical protein EAY75_10665 [Bacteroidetes bacterium]|nr:MAG: hypothetical protein EAY75_10665 [Bacteroidota bacterium]